MKLRKIKWSGGSMFMRWDDEDDRSARTTEFTGYDEPLEEFKTAWLGLVAPCIDLLEIDREWGLIATVSGISITHQEDGFGVVVTLQREIAGAAGPVVLNTPYVTDFGDPGMSSAMVRAVDEVMRCATRYLGGHRVQGDLFAKDAA